VNPGTDGLAANTPKGYAVNMTEADRIEIISKVNTLFSFIGYCSSQLG